MYSFPFFSELMEVDLDWFCFHLHKHHLELKLSMLLSILLDVVKGLHFLHSLGYLHRDICTSKLEVEKGKWRKDEEGGGRREEGGEGGGGRRREI
jgi:hypothetical protein